MRRTTGKPIRLKAAVSSCRELLAGKTPGSKYYDQLARSKSPISRLRGAFQKKLDVRKLNPAARDLAGTFFFEMLIRVHRAGEGAPFTGLKPAGTDIGYAVPAGDKAFKTGSVDDITSNGFSKRPAHLRTGIILNRRQFLIRNKA
jgi:hypothetical protein